MWTNRLRARPLVREFGVVPVRSGTEYTAFSHAWSNGHGYISESGLPRCQVEVLNHVAMMQPTTKSEALLWIDSLCSPEETKYGP